MLELNSSDVLLITLSITLSLSQHKAEIPLPLRRRHSPPALSHSYSCLSNPSYTPAAIWQLSLRRAETHTWWAATMRRRFRLYPSFRFRFIPLDLSGWGYVGNLHHHARLNKRSCCDFSLVFLRAEACWQLHSCILPTQCLSPNPAHRFEPSSSFSSSLLACFLQRWPQPTISLHLTPFSHTN